MFGANPFSVVPFSTSSVATTEVLVGAEIPVEALGGLLLTNNIPVEVLVTSLVVVRDMPIEVRVAQTTPIGLKWVLNSSGTSWVLSSQSLTWTVNDDGSSWLVK